MSYTYWKCNECNARFKEPDSTINIQSESKKPFFICPNCNSLDVDPFVINDSKIVFKCESK